MENYLNEIKKKISGQIKVEDIKVINNSKKHEIFFFISFK